MGSEKTGAWMWERARSLMEEAERLHRHFFVPSSGGPGRAVWTAPADVFETRGEIHILVALPGVDSKQVEVVFKGSTLNVRGCRYLPAALRDAMVSRLEIPHGCFERSITLPRGTFEVRRREMRDGCLSLVLRRLD